LSQIDELKAINRKFDEIDDRRIADNTEKFYEDLNERFPPPDFTRKPSPRTELYAGQFKNPYTGEDYEQPLSCSQSIAYYPQR